MRELNLTEQANLKVLTENSVSLTLIEPTETGLKKSIMDATGPVRNYLKSKRVHDYELQDQGPEHKILIDSLLYQDFSIIGSKASLYRPKTKKGDPRMWFSGLKTVTNENDILAIISFDQRLHVLNISQLSIGVLMSSNITNPIKELISEINEVENEVAQELLYLIKELANRGPVPSMHDADTSVGRSLETELGIQINSSREPDYKGIELKAFRANKGNRKNLFAQVPDWKLSKFKSSSEILDAFGYEREEDFKLYCTVSAITSNSQGLSLKVNADINHLVETSDNKRIGDFVVWTLEKLHQRLLEKHKETFWVAADTHLIDGKNYFQYKEVEHTKKPITSQFDILLEQGIITLDHLIKRNSKGRVVEKGPLFKIKPNGFNLLFPPSEKYQLL